MGTVQHADSYFWRIEQSAVLDDKQDRPIKASQAKLGQQVDKETGGITDKLYSACWRNT